MYITASLFHSAISLDCIFICVLQYKPGVGLSVKCIVSGELNGGGITSIRYDINQSGQRTGIIS